VLAATRCSPEGDFRRERTTDGATSWTQVSSFNASLFGLERADPNTLYAVGNNLMLAKSIDGGATWTAARLQEPVLSKAHTRFRHLWNWTGGEATIMSRAIDEKGNAQPTKTELMAARGVSSVGYHLNPITGWLVRPDGTVVYRAEPWA